MLLLNGGGKAIKKIVKQKENIFDIKKITHTLKKP